MRELPIIDDKRLFGALDYIDERFIAEVTEEYEIFDPAPGAKLPPRARMYRFRQFAAAAACLVLLSVFAAIVPNVANSAIQFLAGAFAENPYKDYDPHSSPVFDYPLSMSVEEIYDEVMLGSWVVSNDLSCVANSQLVEEFYLKVKDKKPASLLLAQYISAAAEEELSYVQEKYEIEKDGSPSIELLEVVYDGEKFIYIFRFIHSATQFEYEMIEEYKHIKKTNLSDSNVKYYLTDDIGFEYGESFLVSSAPSPRYKLIFTYRAEYSPYERAIDSYPQGMSAKEIYDDVLKGGWVVNADDELVGGESLWEDFLAKSENKNDATVLIAEYFEESETILLHSVSYNGEVYTVDSRSVCQLENKDRTYSATKKYLVCHDLTEPGYDWFTLPPKYVWFLTDYPDIHFLEQLIPYVSEDKYEFLFDNYPLYFMLMRLNDK